MSEYHRHHRVLAMIEAAQRSGHAESEIVRLVEEQVTGKPQRDADADEHSLLRSLLGRNRLSKAA